MEQTKKNVSPLSNEARNAYVLEHITASVLKLLQEKDLNNISITEICDEAAIGRTSFYRNFTSKEDVVQKYIRDLLKEWEEAYDAEKTDSAARLYGNFFHHLKEHADFFFLLKERNLLHLFLETYMEINGAKPEDENMLAYTKAFIAYGTYGWIEEWISRGMQESAERMTEMLSSHGMK